MESKETYQAAIDNDKSMYLKHSKLVNEISITKVTTHADFIAEIKKQIETADERSKSNFGKLCDKEIDLGDFLERYIEERKQFHSKIAYLEVLQREAL